MIKIIIVILIIIIFFLIINYFNLFNLENFISENFISGSSNKNSLTSGTKTNNNRIINNIQNGSSTNSSEKLQKNNNVMFSNKDYNENLSIDNKDNTYYYDDIINQNNINESAFNIVYSIDPIDYSDVKTGIEKCNNECKGVCYENGYDGIATCYPKESNSFDFGTLYKNPSFTYGYNAYGQNNLPQ